VTVRIRSSSIVANRAGAYVFHADDHEGPMLVWVTPMHWEQLWLEAPQPATDEGNLAFALRRLEDEASEGEVSIASDGARIRFVG
jgi:hypothetical protein